MLSKNDFVEKVSWIYDYKRQNKKKFLIAAFKHIPYAKNVKVFNQLMESTVLKEKKRGQFLCEQGKIGREIYIIEKGEAELMQYVEFQTKKDYTPNPRF